MRFDQAGLSKAGQRGSLRRRWIDSVDWRERITADPTVLVGKPVIRGTRISVQMILELLAGGYATADVVRQYDQLRVEDVQACLSYAAEIVASEKIVRLPA